jgi:hypothetical protein
MKLTKYTKFREEKFGAVLFETRAEKVFALNPTATAIVRAIGDGCDEAGLIDRLQDQFADTAGALQGEVHAFVADLRKQGLLED